MPTPEDEFEPRSDLVGRVIRRGIRPFHRRLEKAAAAPLPVFVTVWTRDSQGPSWTLSGEPDSRDGEPTLDTSTGEIRLRFRQTYRQDRTLWSAQAHLRGARQWDNVCGYLVSGEILGEGPAERIRCRRTWRDRLFRHHVWRGWQW